MNGKIFLNLYIVKLKREYLRVDKIKVENLIIILRVNISKNISKNQFSVCVCQEKRKQNLQLITTDFKIGNYTWQPPAVRVTSIYLKV